MKYFELALVFFAVLAPQFYFATRVDMDEFTKAGAGAILGGIILSAYRIWRGEDSPTTENP